MARNRIRVTGALAEIFISRGRVALVDAVDIHILTEYRWWARRQNNGRRDIWYASAEGRMESRVRGRTFQMHRVILGLTDPEVIVDHANRNGLDNRRINLRVCSKTQNAANARIPLDNTSGYVGVNKVYRVGAPRWRAYMTIGGSFIHLGMFGSPEEAAIARDREAFRVHGEFAFLNYPETLNSSGYGDAT